MTTWPRVRARRCPLAARGAGGGGTITLSWGQVEGRHPHSTRRGGTTGTSHEGCSYQVEGLEVTPHVYTNSHWAPHWATEITHPQECCDSSSLPPPSPAAPAAELRVCTPTGSIERVLWIKNVEDRLLAVRDDT